MKIAHTFLLVIIRTMGVAGFLRIFQFFKKLDLVLGKPFMPSPTNYNFFLLNIFCLIERENEHTLYTFLT